MELLEIRIVCMVRTYLEEKEKLKKINGYMLNACLMLCYMLNALLATCILNKVLVRLKP